METVHTYEVIVGNIGTVYSGTVLAQAEGTFTTYVSLAKRHHGRAAGENVTLMQDDEPIKEHAGYMERR